jgi:hypothetical protein
MSSNRSVCIVSCSANKGTSETYAEDLYRSETFILARRFAQAQSDRWLIFSAKYGLLPPGSRVAPYDQHISDLTTAERTDLVRLLKRQVTQFELNKQRFTSLCDADYNDVLRSAGIQIEENPVEAFTKSAKLEWLRARTDPQRTESDLNVAYESVRRLIEGQRLRTLRELPRSDIPSSGVYLFFDPNERRLGDSSELRVVRVGTHGVAAGSRASLRDRLRTHLGTATGGGNHRSSVFRLHVGRALMKRGEGHSSDTWGSASFPATARQRRAEEILEASVSQYLGALLVSVIDVPGDASKDNERAYLEQNLIALLSNDYRPLDPPSHGWLGAFSDKVEIRRSGLWNVNHTAQAYQASFLSMLEYYIDHTLGQSNLGPKPTVSPDWGADVRRDVRQITLL